MAVYRYRASIKDREDYYESGTVVARDENEAKSKLKQHKFENIRLKRIEGLAGFFKRFTADIR